MVKKFKNSKIEIWDSEYINNKPEDREGSDQYSVIVQCEYADDDSFIVEIMDEKDYKNDFARGELL